MRGKRWISLAVVVMTTAAATDAQAASDRQTMERYARATWSSMAAMTDPQSGLPADTLKADGTTSDQTSPTNIGAYLWSAVAAERLGVIDHAELVDRLGHTLASLEAMERGNAGQYFNWYNHHTGAK